MKAVLKLSEKTTHITIVNIEMSPFKIIKDIYDKDRQVVMEASRNSKATKGLDLGIIDARRSFFTLIDSEGNYIKADWYVPIKYQSVIVKELEKLKVMHIIPMFLVSVFGYEDDECDPDTDDSIDSFYKSYYYLNHYLYLEDYDFESKIIEGKETIGEFNINTTNKVKITLNDLIACCSWVSEFTLDINQEEKVAKMICSGELPSEIKTRFSFIKTNDGKVKLKGEYTLLSCNDGESFARELMLNLIFYIEEINQIVKIIS